MKYSKFYDSISQIIMYDTALNRLHNDIIGLIESNYDDSTIAEEAIRGLRNYIDNVYNNQYTFLKESAFILNQILNDIDKEPSLCSELGSNIRDNFQNSIINN